MSSILDAVTKDSARSGGVPGAAAPAPQGSGRGPNRIRSAVLVVVFGVAVGALAARMFGGGEPPADDMLTEKVDRGADKVAKGEDIGEPAGGGAGDEAARGSRKDEAAHQRYLAKKKEVAAAIAARAKAPEAKPIVVPAPVASAPSAPAPGGVPPAAVVEVPVPEAPIPADAGSPAIVAGVPVPPAPGLPPAVAIASGIPVPPVDAPAAQPPAVAVGATPPVVVAGSPAAPVVVTGSAPAAIVETAPAPGVVTKVVETEVVTGVAPASPPLTLEPPSEEGEPPVANAAAAPAGDVVSEEKPGGAPEVAILFVAWSREPAERVVSMRVASGTLNVVHEGEYVEGLQVSAIHPEAVDLSWTGQKYRVAVNPF